MTDVVVEGPRPRRVLWIREHPLLGAVGAALLALVVFLLIRRFRGAEEEAAAETPVVTATTEVVSVEPFAVTVTAIGTVEPQPGAEARVAAPAQTIVSRIHVAEGQTVHPGDPLVELDAAVFRARVRGAEAAAEAAERARDRAQRLVAGGISPRKDLEAAEAELAKANAELTEARRIESLAVLRSPIDGVVTSLDVALSQPVDANQSVVQIVNPAGLAVLFRLSPADAGRVSAGAAVALSTPAAGTGPASSSALGEGKVQGVSAAVDSASGGVEVRVAVPNPTRMLRAGESVSGRITLSVPRERGGGADRGAGARRGGGARLRRRRAGHRPRDARWRVGERSDIRRDPLRAARRRARGDPGRVRRRRRRQDRSAAAESEEKPAAPSPPTAPSPPRSRDAPRLFDGLVRQRRFVYLAVALLSAAGIGHGAGLPSSIYPELNFPRITIVAQGTSLGARQQMFSVTRPLEEAVSVVPGVQRVHSRTIRGRERAVALLRAQAPTWSSRSSSRSRASTRCAASCREASTSRPSGCCLRSSRS